MEAKVLEVIKHEKNIILIKKGKGPALHLSSISPWGKKNVSGLHSSYISREKTIDTCGVLL